MSDERNARSAEAAAIGIARRVTHLMPHRLTAVKNAINAIATSSTGIPGRYHCWIADAERTAVNPQVGTHPHQ
jgi:dienelactone hydrolase